MALEFCVLSVFVVTTTTGQWFGKTGVDPIEFVRKNVCLGLSCLGWMGNVGIKKKLPKYYKYSSEV